MQTENRREEIFNEDEINLLDYWNVIWKRKTLIGLMVCIAVVGTAVYSLLIPEIYQAQVVIMSISESKGNSGGLSAFMQQVGELPGVSLPGSRSTTEIVQLLNSKILRKRLMERYKLLPVLFSKDWDTGKKDWKNKDDAPAIWDGLRKIEGMVKVKESIKGNTITITVDYSDPEGAAEIADLFLTALNEYMSSESKMVADTNRKYLEEQLQGTSDPLIKQKIYNLIAQQVEAAMMAGVKENFAFKVIDPPMAPDRRIKPQRRQMVMRSFVLTLFAGIFFSFFMGYLEKTKNSEEWDSGQKTDDGRQ